MCCFEFSGIELRDGVLKLLAVVESLRRDILPVLEPMGILVFPLDHSGRGVLHFHLVKGSLLSSLGSEPLE